MRLVRKGHDNTTRTIATGVSHGRLRKTPLLRSIELINRRTQDPKGSRLSSVRENLDRSARVVDLTGGSDHHASSPADSVDDRIAYRTSDTS
jgi:hypothetical protein